VESFSLYSIMNNPMTSCGCFEVICAYVPECNGVMAVNREYTGDTPVGMTFSTLAGNVGGGMQTPGFMGIGKVFLTSRKFLFTEGGHRRIVWITSDLKELLGDELRGMFEREGYGDLLDKIADESISVDPSEIRAYMEKVKHPALEMDDMALSAQSGEAPVSQADNQPAPREEDHPAATHAAPADDEAGVKLSAADINGLKNALMSELRDEIRRDLTAEIVSEIIDVLGEKFLGKRSSMPSVAEGVGSRAPGIADTSVKLEETEGPSARERIGAITTIPVRKEPGEIATHRVKIGATKAEGGSRAVSYEIGGANAMPFHFWEGEMPNRPLVAMEVFDAVSEKYPPVLKQFWGETLHDPAAMAKICVERYGADVISVRLDSTHPERGDRSPADALKTVKSVLGAVGVPLIVTGHSHFERNNEVMKEIARGCAGENLLLNWVEQDNYRTSRVRRSPTAIAWSRRAPST
jgi:hypothetical protein